MLDTNSTDFTANIQNIISSKPDYLFIVWAGANSPWKQLKDMNVEAQGIKISTGAPDIPALKNDGCVSRNARVFGILSYTPEK